MALRKLFNRAQSYARSPEGRRLFNQGKNALRQRGTEGRGGRRSSGSSGLMGLADRFLGRGGAGGTAPRR